MESGGGDLQAHLFVPSCGPSLGKTEALSSLLLSAHVLL